MTNFDEIRSSTDDTRDSSRRATSMAAAWQLSPNQLDAARKVLQHVQRSMVVVPRSPEAAQAGLSSGQ